MDLSTSTGPSITNQPEVQKSKLFRLLPAASLMRLWGPRGALAIMDQGLISGSNFLVGVALARAGGPEVFGAYTIMYAVFLLIANIYQAILIEPASVLAPVLFPQRTGRYAQTVLRMHAIFTVLFFVAGALAVLIAVKLKIGAGLENALAGMLIATPCILLFWLSRCFAYLELAPGRAAVGAGVYCGILVGTLALVWLITPLTPFIAYMGLGVASVGASLFLLRRYAGSGPALKEELPLGEVWRRHWKFGRWGLGNVGFNWVQGNSISLIVGPVLGISQLGGLNSLNTFLLPINQILQAAARVTMPRIAQIYNQHGGTATKRPVLRVGAVMVALTSSYWLVLTVFHHPLMYLLYGDRFVSFAKYLPILSLNMIGAAVVMTCDIGFSAAQSPRASFKTKSIMAAVMLPLATVVTWRFGLLGIVVYVPSLAAITGILMAFKLYRHWQRTPDGHFY